MSPITSEYMHRMLDVSLFESWWRSKLKDFVINISRSSKCECLNSAPLQMFAFWNQVEPPQRFFHFSEALHPSETICPFIKHQVRVSQSAVFTGACGDEKEMNPLSLYNDPILNWVSSNSKSNLWARPTGGGVGPDGGWEECAGVHFSSASIKSSRIFFVNIAN